MDVIDFDESKAMIISVVLIFNMTPNVNVIAVIIKYPEDRTTRFKLSLSISDLGNGCTVSAPPCVRKHPRMFATWSNASPRFTNCARFCFSSPLCTISDG